MSEVEGFALGRGRARPAYEPKPLQCPQCGGSLALADERTRVVVCPYCHTQIELTATEARAIGAVARSAPAFELDIGAPIELDGVRYEVVGRITRLNPDDPGDDLNHDFFLYNPRKPAVWLSSYRREWWIARRTRVMPVGDAFRQPTGSTLTTHDGRGWRVVEKERSQIASVDGALPWMARVGDETRLAEMVAVDRSGRTYEAEYNARGELEFAEGRALAEPLVMAASGGRLRPRAVAGMSAFAAGADRPRLRAVALVAMAFGVLSLVTAGVFAYSGRSVLSTTIPPQGGRVGPITTVRPNTVLEVDVHQAFRMDGWTYLEAEVQDAEGEYLFGFGDELWAESGYDDGAWHEEKNDYDVCVTMPNPGNYYLAFAGSDSGAGTISPPGFDVGVTVEEKHGSSVPFFAAGLTALILGAFMFLIASSKLRQQLAKAAQSDD